MKKATKLTAAALAATLSLSLAACGSSASTDTASTSASADGVVYRTLDEIKADGTINIGVFSDKNPFGYVDENGEYQGYDIYFANRLAEDLGVKVNYVSTEAANRIEYLQTGKVDVILANFTVTPERAEEVDFALPYMNVALGVVSPDSNVITSLDSWNADDQMIVISGTTAETYLTQNYPDIPLQKYDSYATAKSAMENGGVAWANDNTEVIAFASQNPGYTVGIPSLGSQDTIAPAVSKGNETLLNAINDEIKALGKENFFHADYEALSLTPTALTMRTVSWSRAARRAHSKRGRLRKAKAADHKRSAAFSMPYSTPNSALTRAYISRWAFASLSSSTLPKARLAALPGPVEPCSPKRAVFSFSGSRQLSQPSAQTSSLNAQSSQ